MGLIGRIYEEGTRHCYTLNIYTLGLMVSEENFQSFSQNISLWELYVSPSLMNLYMKFHHIWLNDIEDIFLNHQNDLACIQNLKETALRLAIFCVSSFDTNWKL